MKTVVAIGLFAIALTAGFASASTASSGITVRLSNELEHYPAEGYVWFVRLDRGRTIRVTRATILLPATPGRHVLHAFIRACDGNCSLLDPVEKRCAAVVHRGQTATYHVRDLSCAITVRG